MEPKMIGPGMVPSVRISIHCKPTDKERNDWGKHLKAPLFVVLDRILSLRNNLYHKNVADFVCFKALTTEKFLRNVLHNDPQVRISF